MTIKCSPLLALGFLLFLALASPSQAALTDGVTAVLRWDNGTWMDIKGMAALGLNGCANSTALFPGVGSSARKCASASSDYVQYRGFDFDGYTAYTVLGWVNKTGGSGTDGALISNRDAGSRQLNLYGGTSAFNCQTQTTTSIYDATLTVAYQNKKTLIGCTWDGAKIRAWFNRTVASTTTAGTMPATTADLYINKHGTVAGYWDMKVDEVIIWNRNLSVAELETVYNNGVMLPYPFTAPAGVTASIVMSFLNKTGSVKTVFSEGEEFRPRANFSLSSGVPVKNGYCNSTSYNSSVESDSGAAAITICTSVCASKNVTAKYNRTNTNLAYDVLHFSPCHVAGSGTLQVRFCGAAAISVPAASFPNCPGGSFVFLNSSACKAKGYFAYNITTTANFFNRITVSDVERDAVYSSLRVPMVYNATLKLWGGGLIEFYRHGAGVVNVSCSNVTYSASQKKSFTVVNVRPSVSITGFEFDDATTAPVPGTVEYRGGVWLLDYGVVDDDLASVRVQLRNSSQVIKSVTGFNPVFAFNGSLVADIGVYNVSVRANDTFKNTTYLSRLFTINDTVTPAVSIVSPVFSTPIERPGQNVTLFSASATDENLYSLLCNVTDVLNNVVLSWANYSLNGLTSYTFTNETDMRAYDDGVYLLSCKACDGHTGPMAAVATKEAKTYVEVGPVRVASSDAISTSLQKQQDRYSYSFAYDAKVPVDTRSYVVTARERLDIIEGSEYPAHLVADNAFWVDFEGDGEVVSVKRDSATQVTVTMRPQKADALTLESIGALNCGYSSRSFSLTTDKPDFAVGSTADSIFYIGLLVVGVAAFAAAVYSGGMLWVTLASLAWLVIGIALMPVSWMLGAMCFVVTACGLFYVASLR